MHKTLTALAVAATMIIVAVATPDTADARRRGGRIAAGIIGGLAAGAIIGSMAAQQGYYGDGYYYAPGYYGPDYYGPGPYAYEAPPVYVRPVPRYYRGDYGPHNGCWNGAYGTYGPCD